MAALALAACGTQGTPSTPASKPTTTVAATSPLGPTLGYSKTAKMKAGPNLAPGSKPGVLPTNLLIADRNNNRLIIVNPSGNIIWQFPAPGQTVPGFSAPDDAFFTPNGRDIIATEESNYVVAEISIATHTVVWSYGTPGVPGSAPGHLDNPDDAMMLPNGDVVVADIINCRLLVLKPGLGSPLETFGQPGTCFGSHNPPTTWLSPNGLFPLSNGNYLVTEIGQDWVDELNLKTHQVVFSTHPPGVQYPSDTNQVKPNLFLTADYSNPGQVEEFTASGRLVWRYAPTGANALNKPSLAAPLPNGDVILNDDWNHRVIVVDPQTNQIVWQYGHTKVAGSTPGYLAKPDGMDLAPPYSMASKFGSHMGLP